MAGFALLGWIVLDALRTSRAYAEKLLLSSREGEIEEDLREIADELERIDENIDRLEPPPAP